MVNYIVIIKIDRQKDKILRPEMTTSVNIYMQNRENVLSVPNKALKWEKNKNYLYVLQNNQPVEKEVKTGIRGKYFTEISEGLRENDIIVLDNK